MAQITDLNVSPYYDDFDEADNFHRVLFRPGFAIQARELTQLQSILQNQVERHGNHMFKEGSIVIPGQLSYSNSFETLQLASTFASEEIDPSQYFDSTSPVTITGVTSGVKAYVTGFQAATATTQPILYLNYYKTGSDNSTTVFADGENITADKAITHTTGYATSVASATTFDTSASATGSAATIEDGVIYIRGQFVKVSRQTLLLSANSNTESARVGLTINEELITPEVDSTLTDNSRGSANFAAKGAHRLKISLTLDKLDVTSTDDSKFIEMMRIDSGTLVSKARETEYSVLGDVLARRTFDESGDYTVRPFLFDARESINNTVEGRNFTGVYTSGNTTDDGGTAAEDLLALSCSAGKAYIKGYEFEKLGTTFKDLKKARDFTTINAGVTNLELGNFVRITNLYGTPDIGSVSGETTPYKQIKLFSGATVTRGTASTEEPIGVARVRALEYDSGVSGTNDAVYKAYLFDVRTFTVLTLSDTPSPLLTASHSSGVRITGNTSGATGLVFDTTSDGGGHRVRLTNVVGTFSSGEKLIASDSAETSGLIENSSNTDLTVTVVTTRTFSEARSMFMDDDDTGQDFTADVELTKRSSTDLLQLNATDASLANANDNILLEEDGTTELGLEPIKEAVLVSPEKNIAIYKLPKPVVKTLLTDSNDNASDTSYTIRRQFVATSNSSGVVTLTAGSNEVFGSFVEADYVMSILTAGGGSGVQGQLVPISGKISGTGTASITITDNTILGSNAKVKVIATIVKSSVASKNKTTNLSKQVKVVASDADGAFGCRATDKEISLGRADVFRLQAVFDSEDTSSDATAPTLTLGTVTGTFVRGEKITGSSSGATARIITTTSPIQYALTGGFGATDFTTSDTITGDSSGATSTVSTVTAGSKVITSNFTLDTGQRDNFYDIARIVRKASAEKPLGRLLVVFDFFSHGSGDFFSVDSYSSIAGQMNYDDIPTYSATKIDPDDPKPSGLFPLRDCLDFRPTAENITGATDTLTAVDTITATASSFDFKNRQFDGTGAVVIDTPKVNNALTCDFEHYLSRVSVLYIDTAGEFKIVDGVSAEDPVEPAQLDDAMKLATISLPAFTFTPDDVTIEREETQRFTMRDIGKLQDRIENLEYYTSLNLLERDAESLEITDVNGLNRFKSGFIVDNFAGHKVGDVLHPDYGVAIDMQNREMRPKCVMKAAKLIEKATTDSARTTAGYQKTGDLLTLPYTNKDFITQPYATRPENVQSALIYEYVGKINLTPSGDEWFETEVAPTLLVNVDGNFDAVVAANRNNLGTVWNAWETQWSGVVSTQRVGGRFTRGFGSTFIPARVITNTRSDQVRTGTRTRIVEQVENQVVSNRVISQATIPFVRPRTITGTGECFRPNTRLYAFFDGVAVSNFITPSSTSYTSDTTVAEGSPLITDVQGKVEFSFRIPEYRFAGQQNVPKFKTGEVDFRLTSSETNIKAPAPSTVGQTEYIAKGVVQTTQQTIEATRNAVVVRDTVTQTQSVTDTQSRVVRSFTRPDPLAQTFLIQETGGCFVSNVDLFFSEKDTNLPVWVELREVVNGYPGPTLIPFGRKVLNPNDVNINATTGNTATTFTFDSPVYLKEGIEYCLVVMTNSLNYKVWISGLGETDVSGSNRIISTQPHLGSLFKSQNNTTWSAVQSEDLKFTMRKCNFTSGSGTVTLQNDNIGDEVTAEDGSTEVYGQRLKSNPIILTNSSTVVRVNHPDHGMYSTSNNVTITGVSSGVSTTLNGAITSTGTSVTLTSNTNFPSSGTVHIKIDNEIMSGTISSSTISSITRGQGSTTAAAHSDGATVELYMINSVPLTEINKTHTAIANIGIDSYTISTTTSASISGASTTAQVGGISVYATENYRYETVKTLIGTLELPGTTMAATIKTTNGTSPDGTETSFGQSTTNTTIPLNENFDLDKCNIVASTINETNEISGNKSLEMPIAFTSNNSNVSPVIDLDRRSFIAIANRLNNIDSSSDVFPTTDFVASTEPDGDQNAAIYLTKAVTLEQSATAIRVVFSAHKQNTSEIKVMFKTLRTSDSSDFDELGYEFFNTDGSPDSTVPNSLVKEDFQEYVFTAGVNDDGVGEPLDDFIQFQIKIVMQGTDASKPVRIKDLRAIALST